MSTDDLKEVNIDVAHLVKTTSKCDIIISKGKLI